VASPVVREDFETCRLREPLREVPPESDRAEGVVEEHHDRPVAATRRREPLRVESHASDGERERLASVGHRVMMPPTGATRPRKRRTARHATARPEEARTRARERA